MATAVDATFAGLLILVALSDLWRFRIPNALVLAIAGLFVVSALVRPGEVAWASHAGAGLLMLAAGVLLFTGGVMGAGDGKLLAATSLWAGFEQLALHLLGTALIGLLLIPALLTLRTGLARLAVVGGVTPTVRLPAALAPGRPIPYGVAIAGSALALLST